MALVGRTSADAVAAFEDLAKSARKAWPEIVDIEREGFFSRGRIKKLTMRFPGTAYIARREGLGIVYELGHLSQGVIVHVRSVPGAQWADMLRSHAEEVGAGNIP